MPAIVVGGTLPQPELESAVRRPINVHPVATALWFPGFRNGSVLVVVDKDALAAAHIATQTEIWLRSPPTDAVDQLSRAGLVVSSPQDLSQVFNVTSFLTVRWAYATLSLLGVLIGVVVLFAQFLVLDARRERRQTTHVLTSRMRLGIGGEALGLIAEFGPALVGGAGLGLVIGWCVSRLSIARLDSLRQLEPPAQLVAHRTNAFPVAVGVVSCIAMLTAIGLITVKHTRPMEAMRGSP